MSCCSKTDKTNRNSNDIQEQNKSACCNENDQPEAVPTRSGESEKETASACCEEEESEASCCEKEASSNSACCSEEPEDQAVSSYTDAEGLTDHEKDGGIKAICEIQSPVTTLKEESKMASSCCASEDHTSGVEEDQPVWSSFSDEKKTSGNSPSSCCGGNDKPESDSSQAVENKETDDCSSTESASCSTGEVRESIGVSCCSSGNDEKEESESCCASTQTAMENKESASCCSGNTAEETDAASGSCCSGSHATGAGESCSSTDKSAHHSAGEKIEYRIQGMDCPSCALTIEKGLQRLNSIISAKVSYPTEKLQLVANGNFSAAEVEGAVKKLGFGIEPISDNRDKHTYEIAGMDCGSCAKSIENHLMKVPGVQKVAVSFATGKMTAEHTIPVGDVIKEVGKIGFRASLQKSNSKPEGKSQNHKELSFIIFSGLLIATGFIGSYIGMPHILSTVLFAAAIVTIGFKPIKSAYYAVKSGSLDMNVLMSAAAIGAAIIGEWFEGATVIWLFSLGIYLQNRSMDQTRKSIRNLMNMAPSTAWVQAGSELVRKPVEEISVGEMIIIKPGDKIPLDGKIIEGESSINQAPITGESLPVDKAAGDAVYAGTMNESGSLDVRVTKLVEDTTLSKIIKLVEEAQEQKAPTQAFIDRFASIYTPIVFILALSVIVFPPLFGFGAWGEWVYKGLALLVVACPCALVISTPVAIVSAIGNAAKHGVLIKGGTFLEAAGAIDAIAFDKTGTLTEGKPTVSQIQAVNCTEDQLLSIVGTLESRSTHPIAKTIVDYARDKGISFSEGEMYKNIVGKGVQGQIGGMTYYAGSPRLFEELGIELGVLGEKAHTLEEEGKTMIIVGNDQAVLGMIAVSDAIRPVTVKDVEALKRVGVGEAVMLTGDNKGTASFISGQTGVNRFFAELLPEDKVGAVKKLQEEGKRVAMVGDGINDAPALATADLGIAMGATGTDSAMETADIVLMADNLEKLSYTVRLSRKALAIIKQNIWFSILIKLVALVLIFPGWLTLWMAVLSDTGAAILVILNALRLLRVKE